MTKKPEKTARVFLVGAGPGDPGLITVEGLRRLREADVVVFDALANPVLLDEASPTAELVDVGKRGGFHKFTQDAINDLLVEKATPGRTIVRLKGGDPYLFGRGAEEAIHLAKHGITCRIIPGVTSGIAVPGAAGIPVTHRAHASTVTFVTGHEDPAKPDTAVNYKSLSRLIMAGGTVCFYMGIGKLPQIAESLIGHGLDHRTPAASIEWGTLPKQKHLRSTIGRIAHDVSEKGLKPPAITVVGSVAGFDEPGLDWFIKRPLFGQRILVTRSRQQASDLRMQLVDLGAEVLEAPTIELVTPPDDEVARVEKALQNVHEYDWLILTSTNGVAAVAQRFKQLNRDARSLGGVKVAAIGDATASALQHQLGIRADLVPTRYVAESLAGELIADHDIAGKKVLMLRADIARPALPKLLTEAGAAVTELCAYETKVAAALPEAVLEALRGGSLDWVTFTSSSTAQNLATLLGPEADLVKTLKIASIGPITSETIRNLGWPVTLEAETSNIPGLVAAIEAAV